MFTINLQTPDRTKLSLAMHAHNQCCDLFRQFNPNGSTLMGYQSSNYNKLIDVISHEWNVLQFNHIWAKLIPLPEDFSTIEISSYHLIYPCITPKIQFKHSLNSSSPLYTTTTSKCSLKYNETIILSKTHSILKYVQKCKVLNRKWTFMYL